MTVSILYPSITFHHDGVPRKLSPLSETFFRNFVYPSKKARIAAKLCQNAFRTIPDISFFDVENCFKTSNGRLPPEDGSDRPQTSGKRVSGDPRHLIFRHQKLFCDQNFCPTKFFVNTPKMCFSKVPVLEELCWFGRHWQMRLENSLPDI